MQASEHPNSDTLSRRVTPSDQDSTGGTVSVVIPVWDDYVESLPKAVASVRDDFPEAHIVVVDNASSTLIPSIPGTDVVRATGRLSVGAARNLGVAHVDSAYTMVMDADDTLLPGTLGFLRSRLEHDPGVAFSAVSILESETEKRHRAPRPWVRRLARFPRVFAAADAIWSLVPIQGCALLRTEQIRESGGYPDSDWGDDWVLAVSLAFRGRVEVHERPGRRYHRTPGSISERERSPHDLMSSASLVRRRLREDPAIPAWAARLSPLLVAMQFLAVYLARPLYHRLRMPW
jgi:glycosyltransferase involved in cell wall biosynthesis